MRLREAIGRGIGGLLAPLAAEGSLIRGARLFHPDGMVLCADVTPIATEGAVGELAHRLSGHALVRFSGALWRAKAGDSMPDVLGVAVRFTSRRAPTARPIRGDQDLLFATIRSLLLLPIAPFMTNTRDYLANTYDAGLPFCVEGLGQVRLRLTSQGVRATGKDRRARLEHAVATGHAVLKLLVQRSEPGALWMEVAAIKLRALAEVDQAELAMNPFRTGRGIVPVGMFQAMRAAVYPASQLGRRLARGMRPAVSGPPTAGPAGQQRSTRAARRRG